MSSEYNAVQESIKIALDAADAATDVSSEFNKIKRENKKLEGSIKMIHRYTAIIFASSMVAAVAALIFASLIYFRTLSDLTTMTTTSREALIVFAENVDTMNSSLDKLKVSLEAQQELVSLNKTLIAELDTLRTTIIDSNREVIASMRDSNEKCLLIMISLPKRLRTALPMRWVARQVKLPNRWQSWHNQTKVLWTLWREAWQVMKCSARYQPIRLCLPTI